MSDRLMGLAWYASDRMTADDREHDTGDEVPPGRSTPPGDGGDESGSFVWRQGRADLILRRDGDAWTVACWRVGRLLGPRHLIHHAYHQRADLAAIDVMARVIQLTRDEQLALVVGLDAARWIRATALLEVDQDVVLTS